MDERDYIVTIVCSGNTCRSPMAEGILKKTLAERGVTGIKVRSAGTLGIIDEPATALAVEVSRSFGVDIGAHRSQAFDRKIADSSDLVLALSAEHFGTALRLNVSPDNLFMLKTFPRHTRDLHSASIADPIGGDLEKYKRIFMEIDKVLQQGTAAIIRRAEKQQVRK